MQRPSEGEAPSAARIARVSVGVEHGGEAPRGHATKQAWVGGRRSAHPLCRVRVWVSRRGQTSGIHTYGVPGVAGNCREAEVTAAWLRPAGPQVSRSGGAAQEGEGTS